MLMSIIAGSFSPALLKPGNSSSKLVLLSSASPRRTTLVVPSSIRASAAAVTVTAEPKEDPLIESKGKNILACPVCFSSLRRNSQSLEEGGIQFLQCTNCIKKYSGTQTHLDLTVSGPTLTRHYGEEMPLVTELFRSPLVSYLYERGWRQNFIWGGFPGPEKEFEMAKRYLKEVVGGNIVDASCGSGLFARLFAESELFEHVIALDFSENMLRQCYDFILQQPPSFPKQKIELVRADIARLPFLSGSVDAVHAGAALHCWPSPFSAVAEISRVLRPGGVFVATTFIYDSLSFIPFAKNIRQELVRNSGAQLFMSEGEIKEICSACGLVGFTSVRNSSFIMLSASKPPL